MSSNIVNNMPYIRTTRRFPEEIGELAFEVNKAYLDIANAVNERTIGIFPTSRSAITGESWFLVNNNKQQTFRKVFTFTSTSSIDHGITNITPGQFTRCFGSYTNGTNNFGLLFATSVAVAGVISFYVTNTQIVFVLGAGAPALSSGCIVLEWLSNI